MNTNSENAATAFKKVIQAIVRFICLIVMLIGSLVTILGGVLLAILVISLSVILAVSLLAILVISIVWVWDPEIWDPKILDWLSEYEDIITIITLLASIGLFSFLYQRYARDSKGVAKNKEKDLQKSLPAKDNIGEDLQVSEWWPEQKTFSDTWKAMTQVLLYSVNFAFRFSDWFLLLFAILATFRATIFLLYPLLSEKMVENIPLLSKVMAKNIEMAWNPVIITIIITLIITIFVSLIMRRFSFRLQRDAKDCRKKDIGEFLFTPQFLLVLAILVPATLLMPFRLYPQFMELAKNISEDWDSSTKIIITIISLLTTIGIFTSLFQTYVTDIKLSLLNISNQIFKAFRGKWLPMIDSLSETQRCYIAKAPLSIKKVFFNALMLVCALWIGHIIFFFLYLPINALDDWQNEVVSKLDAIPPDPQTWRDSVTKNLDNIRTDTANLMLLRSSGHSPSYLSTEKGTISFLLVYPSQGDLDSKKGICPEGDNLIWLTLFKKAFSKCSKDEQMNLKIQGFASAAPVRVNGATTKSDSLNCEIANQRAKALFYFLMLDDPKSYTQAECKAILEKRHAKSDSTWDGQDFKMTYKPWQNYAEMDSANTKPIQDNLRLDLEFLNRTVEIIIEEGGCLTKAIPASQQAVNNDEKID